MVAGDACVGETPAAWMTPVMVPIAVAASTSAWTDSREETSTVAVLTSNPASPSTFAAASAFSRRRSASRTCLPALTRRAIAWPIDPAPMTTITLVMMLIVDFRSGAALSARQAGHGVGRLRIRYTQRNERFGDLRDLDRLESSEREKNQSGKREREGAAETIACHDLIGTSSEM